MGENIYGGWLNFNMFFGKSIYEKFLCRTTSQRKRRKFARHKNRSFMKRK